MNYDEAITQMINELKADKSIAQPWKNYATSDLLRVQAVIRMGKTVTKQEPPADMQIGDPKNPAMAFAGPKPEQRFIGGPCICQPDMPPRLDCPMHGGEHNVGN